MPYDLSDLEEILPHSTEPQRPTMLPEAALMELRANLPDFQHTHGRCRFAVGDEVIPKRNALAGTEDPRPRVVVAVNPAADYVFQSDPATPLYGLRYDIRVLGFYGDTMMAFWTESAYYEPYRPEA